MRILHLITDMEVGGAQRLLADLLPLQAERGDDEVTLCVLNGEGDDAFMHSLLSDSGIKVTFLNPAGKKSAWQKIITARTLRKTMRGKDIVHVHLFPSLYYAALAGIGLKSRLVYTEHSTFNKRRLHKLLRPLERLVYARYKNIICISEAVRNNLAQWIGRDKGDPYFRIVENGIPAGRLHEECTRIQRRIRQTGNKDELRKEIFGRPGVPVLMISRFVDSKDHPTLLRAIKEIDNQDIFAVLVGDGMRREEYETLVKELGIEERVCMPGTQSDIGRLIAASEIGVQSSNWEGFGLTVVEMMAGGLPVVVSDVEGLAGVGKGCALTFRRGDYKTLARRIESLAGDEELRQELREKGLERAREYDISKMAAEYRAIYSR